MQRAKELCEARGVTKGEVLRLGINLFEGKTLIWYRTLKDTIVDWSFFVDSIRSEFELFDYDEKLLEKIKVHTQGKEEAMGIYSR